MTNAQQYRSQADAHEAAAEGATLDNVRERWLRSAAVWRSMADRIERTDALRAERAGASG